MSRPHSVLALAALLLAAAPARADDMAAAKSAAPRCTPAPLLQPGKSQLLDRVLVRPGATLTPAPGAEGGKPVPAFSVLFIYDRSPDGKSVQVGARSDCKPEGWVRADSLVPWRHVMVAAFTERSGRDRVSFFGTPEQARALTTATDPAAAAKALDTASGLAAATAGIVAREPETPVDFNKHFYLLPILDAQTVRFASQAPARVLHLASLSLPDAPKPTAPASPPTATRHNFRTAVVFVMDATQSMDPYLDRIRKSLDRIYARIEAEHIEDRVRFGLVAFRDDPKKVPKIEYGTKVFADPNKIATRAEFDQATAGLTGARVSSRANAEDVYAGLEAGIDGIDWHEFDGRFVILVTDASAREPTSGIVATQFDAASLAILAREKHVVPMALHLLTPEGGDADHRIAERQYTGLTKYPDRASLYYPIPAGNVDEYGKRLDAIADALVKLIGDAEDNGPPPPDTPPAKPNAPKDTASAPANDIAAVGYAMRLAYLGRQNDSVAPTMVESWALDRDIVKQAIPSMDVRVLLTKSELSDLASTALTLGALYDKNRIDPGGVYAQMRSAAATLSRDPAKIGAASNRDLTAALMGEYLEGLPYLSTLMKASVQDWGQMSTSEQQDIIDGLAVKVQLYRHMQDDSERWVTLAPGAGPQDAVYPVPVNALP